MQLLATVARVAAYDSSALKSALLAAPTARQSLYTSVAEIRALDKSALRRIGVESAQQAEQLWTDIADGLGVDLSKPFVASPVTTVKCGNPACSSKTAASACAACVKTSSPIRYCGATCAFAQWLQR